MICFITLKGKCPNLIYHRFTLDFDFGKIEKDVAKTELDLTFLEKENEELEDEFLARLSLSCNR